MDIKVVIPARLQSSRLPQKPLIDLAGKPMIVRTYERCLDVFEASKIVVATDSDKIVEVCTAHSIATILTRSDHNTGTDRVAEVAMLQPADLFINVQGDEPLFEPADLQLLLEEATANPEIVINGYCPIQDQERHHSRTTPKVVFDQSGKLLYMSRAPIPGGKSGEFRFGYRQVCAYSFPSAALALFRDHPAKTPLEEVEDIEILRFVELGVPVRMIPMSDRSIPVDVPADVEEVLAVLAAEASGE